jgi:peptide/nickel transport system permease protein
MSDLSLAGRPPASALRSRAWRWLRNSGATIGGAIVLLAILCAIAAPLLAPYDPYLQDLPTRLKPPVWSDGGSWAHALGTDQLGRDYLSRLIYGSRISLLIGFGTVLISGSIGILLGMLAGYYGGRLDMVISFFITVRLAMPIVLVALAVVGLIGSSLTVVVAVLGLLLWDRFAVVARATVMQLRDSEYIVAARSYGGSDARILLWHVLPNILGPILVVFTLEIAHAILLEAALSFLGLGVQPPLPSWGLMIAEGRNYVFFTPWVITIPGVALVVLVLGINLLGDGLRDLSSPRDAAD